MFKIVSSCPSYTVFQKQEQEDEEDYQDDGQHSKRDYTLSPPPLLDDTNSASSSLDDSEILPIVVGGSSTTVKPLVPVPIGLGFPHQILQAQLRYGGSQIRQPLFRPILPKTSQIQILPSRRPLPQLVRATNLAGILTRPPVPPSSTASGSGPGIISSTPFSLTRHLLEAQGNSSNNTIRTSSGTLQDRINERIQIIKRPPGATTGSVAQIRQNPPALPNNNDPGDPSCPYTCSLCDKTYVHLRSLKDHMKAHRGLTQCPECNKSFSKVANMRAHFAVQHAGKRETLSPGFSPSEVLQSQMMMQSIQNELARRNNSNSSPPGGSGSSSSGAT